MWLPGEVGPRINNSMIMEGCFMDIYGGILCTTNVTDHTVIDPMFKGVKAVS